MVTERIFSSKSNSAVTKENYPHLLFAAFNLFIITFVKFLINQKLTAKNEQIMKDLSGFTVFFCSKHRCKLACFSCLTDKLPTSS